MPVKAYRFRSWRPFFGSLAAYLFEETKLRVRGALR
jgi:hypothetical protein